MTPANDRNTTLNQWCESAIGDHLGDISYLPKSLVTQIRKVYREFMTAYLNVLRQKEKKPRDWYPQTRFIDLELADDMRHFFSDYQHVTKAFFMLNAKMEKLRQIDQQRQPHLYQHAVADILSLDDGTLGFGE